jgi:hypothetical protein
MKTRRYKRKALKSRRNRRSRYFYPYNTEPKLFTRTSHGGDSRHTLLPAPLVAMARDASYAVTRTADIFRGHYPGTNPSVLKQNLS